MLEHRFIRDLNIQFNANTTGGEKVIPYIVHQGKKPRDGKGYTWNAVHENSWNRSQITGRMKVARFSSAHPPEDMETYQLAMHMEHLKK